MALTPEQLEARKIALARGRETAAANRKAKAAAEPAPVAMPAIEHEGINPESGPVAIPTEEGNAAGHSESADGFERFLAAQDDETRSVLSDMELRLIYEIEVKRAADERKNILKKAAATKALRHARTTAGLIPAEAVAAAALRDRLNQKVTWTVNMPEAGNSGMLIDEGMRIDGRLLYHGQEVVGTMAEYESYRDIEWRAHQHELDFQGKGKLSRLRQTATGFLNMRAGDL